MQKASMLFLLLGLLALLGGCTEDTAKPEDSTKKSPPAASAENTTDDEDVSTASNETEESLPQDTASTAEKSGQTQSKEGSRSQTPKKSGTDNDSSKETNDPLDSYSREEIEYARVWTQLGPNQELDELNIRHIPPGEPVNPNIDNSAVFPGGVIQLSGSRLIDGSVTYRGNGDGTIHVYATPMRWEAPPPDADEKELQKDTEDILKNTELVHIEPRDGQEIISLIERLKFR
ncbi:hypothetical protein [Metabacillus sp. SLBN-84]